MKIASWNVNSLKVRLPQVVDWLEKARPDILALQETKMTDEIFPAEEIEAAGYQVTFSGQKTYNGVAIISKHTMGDPVTDIPGFSDPQRRFLSTEINGVHIINIYVPNGQEVGSEKYIYKIKWLNALLQYIDSVKDQKIILLGDYNIAPTDRDIHDPKRWRGKIMCSDEERQLFYALVGRKLKDAVREVNNDDPLFTWWDYRLKAFDRGWGIRIDHILTSESISISAAGVDLAPRANERPSDHTPVWVEYC